MADMFPNAVAYERLMGRWSERLAPLFLDFACFADGSRLLDVGCGTGALVDAVAKRCNASTIVGIDPSQPFIDYARQRFPNPRFSFDCGDGMALAVLAAAAFAACTAWAAQPELEPGNWKLHVVSTTNGKPEPVQNTEECLGHELKDLGTYFAPDLEGVKAKCKKTRLPSSDPRKLVYRTQCTGSGFTVEMTATVTIESSRHFTASMRMNTKTKMESALVVADVDGRWAAACKK